MGVSGIESVQDDFLKVSVIIAIGVFQEDQVWLLCDIDASISEFNSRGQMQAICEDRLLVGTSIAVRVFEDQNFVIDFFAWQVHRIGSHCADPEAAFTVEGDLHGILEFGKLDFGSEQVDFEAPET